MCLTLRVGTAKIFTVRSTTSSLHFTQNGISIDRVQELCREASGIGFPTQNTFVTFRADDDSRDLARPRAIITALAPNLTELPN